MAAEVITTTGTITITSRGHRLVVIMEAVATIRNGAEGEETITITTITITIVTTTTTIRTTIETATLTILVAILIHHQLLSIRINSRSTVAVEMASNSNSATQHRFRRRQHQQPQPNSITHSQWVVPIISSPAAPLRSQTSKIITRHPDLITNSDETKDTSLNEKSIPGQAYHTI